MYFFTICDNSTSVFSIHCSLSMLGLEGLLKIVAVIKATTHQGISCQDSSLISQILSEVTHLNEAYLTNIADMISKGEISIKPDTKVFSQQLLDA